MEKEIKRFSEVKLRKLDDNVTLELNAIMNYYQQVSASGGLTQYILEFSRTKDRILNLENQNRELRNEIYSLKSTVAEKDDKLNAIKNTYETLVKLMQT